MGSSSVAGRLLIARPVLRDGFFSRAVILMLQHNDEGAFGLVLNRPASTKDLPFPIYIGGPCKMDGLLMIHGEEQWLQPGETAEVCPGVYLGTSEQFEKATEMGEDATDRFRVFTGYSGWGPKQLEFEMQENSWIVLPSDGQTIFETSVDELWERLAPTTLPHPSMN